MGRLLQSISRDLLIKAEDLDYLIRSAPYRYKVYSIPKRQTGKLRVIAQPAREVKRLQYWVLKKILAGFPVHPSAVAYRKGKSILDNAKPHAGKRYLLKLDFTDFFHSITVAHFERFMNETSPNRFDEIDLHYLTRILFWNMDRTGALVLSIGAPSSPTVSNIIMHAFDTRVAEFCRTSDIVYTRYADDLSFSADKRTALERARGEVERVCRQLPYPLLRIHQDKTVYASKAGSRRVTGLVLANEGGVSLGHRRKRELRAAVHHFKLGKLKTEEASSLAGMLAFVYSVEPQFLQTLTRRYGKDTVRKLLRVNRVSKHKPTRT